MKDLVIDMTMQTPQLQPVRRAEPRYQSCPGTSVQLIDKDQRLYMGRAYNLSRQGLGLILDSPLMSGESLTVVLQSIHQDAPVELSARVVHATRRAAGEWLIGFRLAEPLSDQELQQLL